MVKSLRNPSRSICILRIPWRARILHGGVYKQSLSAVDVAVVGADPRSLALKLRDSIGEVFGSPAEIEANVRSEGRLAAWAFPDEKSIAINFCATICHPLFFERGAHVSLRDARLDSQRNQSRIFRKRQNPTFVAICPL